MNAKEHLNAVEQYLLSGMTPIETLRHIRPIREALEAYEKVEAEYVNISKQNVKLADSNAALSLAIQAAGGKK